MLGVTAGLDPQKLIQVVSSSSGNSNAFKSFSERALSGKLDPSFALNLAYKDLHLALELGDELGVPLPQGSSTHNLQRLARGMGLGQGQLGDPEGLRDGAGADGQAVRCRAISRATKSACVFARS